MFDHWGPGNRTEFLAEAKLNARAGAVCVLVDYPWARPAPHRKPLKQEGDHALFVEAVVDLRRALGGERLPRVGKGRRLLRDGAD